MNIFFLTIVKAHNEKTIDHTKFHTKPQKWQQSHTRIVNIHVFIYLWFQANCQPSDASFPAY